MFGYFGSNRATHFGSIDATVIGLLRGNEKAENDYFVIPANIAHEEHVYCPGINTN